MESSLSTVLKDVESRLSTIMDTRNFFMASYDRERDWIRFLFATHDGKPVAVGEPESPPLYQDRPLENGLIEYVIRNRKPLLIEENLDECVKVLGVEILPAGIKCWMGAPVIVGNRYDGQEGVLGVIGVQSFERGHVFDETHLGLLCSTANQAAIALEKERLFQELEERARRLEELQRVTTVVSAEPSSLEGVLQTIVDSLRDMFPQASCAVRLYDQENNKFKEHVAAGVLEDCCFSPRRRGTSRYVIENKEPYYIQDTAAPRPKGQPGVRNELIERGVRAIAYLLLIREERVIGLLHLNLMVPHSFSQNEKMILELFANQAAVAVENARLYAQRVSDIAAFQEINAAITTKDWLEITKLIAAKAQDLTQAQYGALWLADDKEKKLDLHSMLEESEIDHLPIDENSINGWVAMTRKPYICGDIKEDPHYVSCYVGVQSNMAVPVIFANRLIGTLSVESTKREAFSDYQCSLLQSLADQVAIVIENARLFKDSQRRVRDLGIIDEVMQTINRTLDTRELLRTIVSLLANRLHCTHCTIFLPEGEESGQFLIPHQSNGEQSERVWSRSFKSGKGLAGWVFKHGKSLVLPDAKKDPRFAAARAEQDSPRSMLVVPIMASDQPIGVISMDQDKPDWFSESDRRLVEAIALQAGIAIQRSTTLDLLQNIGAKLAQAQVDLDEALAEIAQSANTILQAFCSTIFIYDSKHERFEKGIRRGTIDIEPALPTAEGLAACIVRTATFRFVDDIADNSESKSAFISENKIRAFAGVPLIVGENTVVGVLFVNYLESHVFSSEEQNIIDLLAHQAAVAIQTARLYRQMQSQLSSTETQREALQRLVGFNDLAGRFVHRVSNLAGTIPLMVEYIREELESDPFCPERVLADLEQIKNQTKQLLAMARRIQKSTQKLQDSSDMRFMEVVDVIPLLDETLTQVLASKVGTGRQDRIAIKTTYEDSPLLIETFESIFTEALSNLIANAMESMPDGGILTLGAEREQHETGEYVVVTVADTGVGIPVEDIELVFDITYSKKPNGFGYGLWLVKHFCDATGARIKVESEEGKGTIFRLYIPVAWGGDTGYDE